MNWDAKVRTFLLGLSIHVAINLKLKCKILNSGLLAMFIERTIQGTKRIQQMCKMQQLNNFKRNAEILTELKYGKRKKKTSGKCKDEKYQIKNSTD